MRFKWLQLSVLFLAGATFGQTVIQAPVPKFRSFLPSGAPNAGGCVYTYASGTTTPQNTFTDFTGLTANTNPVVLDGNGEAQIWITGAVYRFQVWSFGQGTLGNTCGNGTQLYQIDGVRDSGLSITPSTLAAVTTIITASNNPTITTVNPGAPNQNYNIPDPGTGGNFVINPSGNSGTANVLDCTLTGITCKRLANYFFRAGGCVSPNNSSGFDTFGGVGTPYSQCIAGNHIVKGALALPSAYNLTQTQSGTNNATTTVTLTYPKTILGGNGDLLVAAVTFNATTTITGCTDGTNAYTQAKHVANGALSVDIWYFANPTTKPAGTTLTCTFAGAATGALQWAEYQVPGGAAVSLDQTASNTGTGTAITTGTTSPLTQATELIFGVGGNISNASVGVTTSGLTDHVNVISNAISSQDSGGLISQATTGTSLSLTNGNSVAWAGAIATFKATQGTFAIAEQSMVLPSTWNSAVAINGSLKLMTTNPSVGSPTAQLGMALVCVADNNTDDPIFNPLSSGSLTISNLSNVPQTVSFTGINDNGCVAGQTLHLQVQRVVSNVNDIYESPVSLLGVVLTLGITQ